MKHLQRWTVCLNNTHKDNHILFYVSKMAKHYRPESLQLLHVIDEKIPEGIFKEYSEEPELKYYKSILEDKVELFLSDLQNVTTDVRKGNAQRNILESTYENDTDLIILGRGKGRKGVVKKVTRAGNASVMIIPQDAPVNLEHVVISTDFSAHSKRALQIGTSLAEGLHIAKSSALHVYYDASKYVRETVETSFDVDQLIRKRSMVNEKLYNFMKVKMAEHVTEAIPDRRVMQFTIPADRGLKQSEAFVQWVKESDVDFVVLGAKGQSTTAAFFLGSFAEDVYTRLDKQVILLFKQEGETSGIMKSLFRNRN